MPFIVALVSYGCTPEDFSSGVSAYKQEDYPRALEIFTRLAEQGDSTAQYNVGIMYHWGRGVPQDYQQAVKWYRKAAEQGHVGAQYALGFMYRDGKGLPRHYVQALKWFYLAKTGNEVQANQAIQWIVPEMSRQQIEQAEALATEWWDNHHQ